MNYFQSIAHLISFASVCDAPDVERIKTLSQHIIEQWSLGRDVPVEFSAVVALRSGDHSRLIFEATMRQAISDALSTLTPEGVDVLSHDIQRLFLAKHVRSQLDERWRLIFDAGMGKGAVSIAESIHALIESQDAARVSPLVATGLLFACALSVDGSITRGELFNLRESLQAWDCESARIIVCAVDQSDSIYAQGGTLALLGGEEMFSSKKKQTVLNCIETIRLKFDKGVRKIIYDQIVGIIKADGEIHANERWIWLALKDGWIDLEGN